VRSQTEIRIGSEFVGYRIDELIGCGGMGVVYRAYDLRLKRTVALKLVAPELALDERFRARFARETELAMSLEHPNVVPIHDAGDVGGDFYLAMRLVVGTDLRKLLRAEGALEPARVVAICRQVAGALDAAHDKGLVHRDVKPSNVLLDEKEHVYLADFGLTRRLGEQEAPVSDGRSLGTLAYVAPEQIESRAVDGRADVYALGCMLFECLTGTPPYLRGSLLETAWAHLEEAPPAARSLGAELPESVDSVFSTALAKEPGDRYATCTMLIVAVEEALGFRKAGRLGRTRSLLVATAALVAVIAAVVATAVLATRGNSGATAPPLYAGANTLARIDPRTDRVSAVIRVGEWPAASAVGGKSVWVYNEDSSTVSEIDSRTNLVRMISSVPGPPAECCGYLAGPALAADATGAWFVSASGKPLLTHLLAGRRRTHQYALDLTPSGVAVGYGAVWVVGRGAHDYQLLRIDPGTGRVTARRTFPDSSPVDSVAVAFGSVWAVGSADATLYRINPRTAEPSGHVVVGNPPAGRPQPTNHGEDWVNVPYTTVAGSMASVYPASLTYFENECSCQPDSGENTSAFGSDWFDDWPTGSVYRMWAVNGPTRRIAVAANLPVGGGPCLTSMAIGAGSAWVTVAPSSGYTCAR
jgi:hypothetical protein